LFANCVRAAGAPVAGSKIAAACRVGRHRAEPRAADLAACPFVVAEEEPAVLRDRSANRGAELVLLGLRQESPGQRVGGELRERIARLELVALEELEGAAVQRIGARLGLHRDHPCRGLAELGVVVLRGDLRFPDRLQGGIDDDDPEDRVAILGAVELVRGSAEMLAVHHRLRRPLRVLAGRMLPAQLLSARRQQDELGEVAVEDGEVGQLARVERGRDVGAIGTQQR